MVEVYLEIVKFNTKNKVELKKLSIEHMEEIKKILVCHYMML
jgi:hypothetical protein